MERSSCGLGPRGVPTGTQGEPRRADMKPATKTNENGGAGDGNNENIPGARKRKREKDIEREPPLSGAAAVQRVL